MNTLQGGGLREWRMLIHPTIIVGVLATFSHNRLINPVRGREEYQEWDLLPVTGQPRRSQDKIRGAGS